MATPHIRAEVGEIAKCILLPGDPYRAKYIAENFLDDAVLFNDVRGMLGFTGTYKGKRISVMGTGMGIPSIYIYAHELMSVYGAETLIRVGTCGIMRESIRPGSIILAQGCCTDSDINTRIFPGTFAPVADFQLLRTAYKTAEAMGIETNVGNMITSDQFYSLMDNNNHKEVWARFGVLGVDMEGAGLYTAAARNGARALSMYTVGYSADGSVEVTNEDRRRWMDEYIAVALETASAFAD